MLKIQELQIDGHTFRLREPRLRDYVRARDGKAENFAFLMLAGMLLDENDNEFGEERVMELPLRSFDRLSATLDELTKVTKDPLAPSEGSSTASP